MSSYLQYWGKAHDESFPGWHPLAYHSLDVAAVTLEYLKANPQIRGRLAALGALPDADVLAWMTFLAGAHDVGKFDPGFQAKQHAWCPVVLGETAVAELNNHQVTGVSILVDWLGTRQGGRLSLALERSLERLANVACAHHGSPVDHKVGLLAPYPVARAAAHAYLADLWVLSGMDAVSLDLLQSRQAVRQLSWLASGVVMLADWVGSSRESFPYQGAGLDVASYFDGARGRARDALQRYQLVESPRSTESGFRALFARPEDGAPKTPTPLQAYADTVALPATPSPQLFILEDETGAGKTEAALTLASRLMAADFVRGLFFCLPTQTTANAVFQRIAPLVRLLFAAGSKPAVSLAHGQAQLALQALMQDEQLAGSISSHLGSWAQERNKTALLADLGVGTIDQVVLAGLPARHASLRVLGLAQKVLVVDEVHACDTYQLGLLANVLEEHARLGGSAIVLSATLPREMKRVLTKAFARGLGADAGAVGSEAYPLATAVGRTGCIETAVASRRDPRKVAFEPIAEKEIVPLVDAWMGEGKCVCILRNTVALAQAQYDFFKARYGDRVRVVHARFITAHRAENDQRLLADFGKASGSESRCGQLVIATQVVEASLDIDFDELITDLAPIDSLLQRLGRWRRHLRDKKGVLAQMEGRAPSKAYVLAPDPRSPAFLTKLSKGTAFVYPALDVLWRTACIVHEWGSLVVPTQVREAVEFAYQEGAVPPWLEVVTDINKGAELAAAQLAYGSVLKWEEGYHPQGGVGLGERAVTRLGEASVQVVLCNESGRPLEGVGHFAESASLLSLRYAQVGGCAETEGKVHLRMKRDEDTGAWMGAAVAPNGGREYTARYSRDRGLSLA